MTHESHRDIEPREYRVTVHDLDGTTTHDSVTLLSAGELHTAADITNEYRDANKGLRPYPETRVVVEHGDKRVADGPEPEPELPWVKYGDEQPPRSTDVWLRLRGEYEVVRAELLMAGHLFWAARPLVERQRTRAVPCEVDASDLWALRPEGA